MNNGALNDALKTGRRFAILIIFNDQSRQLIINIIGQIVLQNANIDAAGFHYGNGIDIFCQRQKQMLQSRIFMAAVIGQHQRAVQSLLKFF